MPLIETGKPAPAFTLKDQHGKSHALKDYRGQTVVLYFYPEDDTPLCTAQACQFRDHHPEFTKIKAVVLGISPQGVDSKRAFADTHALPFTLLADDAGGPAGPKVSVLYGAWGDKNMYGKAVRGMARTTYLIGPDGKVVRRWDRVKTPGHAAAVLGAVKALQSGERLTVLGTPKKVPPAKAKKTTRTQGGHAGYSGIAATRGKSKGVRAVAARAASKGAARRSR
ncbi:MAG: peroxiredoxin [Phycisphaeraceae bacterium]|nr:MAG: peroxiredoxin [Phycisphaeraceae bacterium]